VPLESPRTRQLIARSQADAVARAAAGGPADVYTGNATKGRIHLIVIGLIVAYIVWLSLRR
jgi:hypothetical protein